MKQTYRKGAENRIMLQMNAGFWLKVLNLLPYYWLNTKRSFNCLHFFFTCLKRPWLFLNLCLNNYGRQNYPCAFVVDCKCLNVMNVIGTLSLLSLFLGEKSNQKRLLNFYKELAIASLRRACHRCRTFAACFCSCAQTVSSRAASSLSSQPSSV